MATLTLKPKPMSFGPPSRERAQQRIRTLQIAIASATNQERIASLTEELERLKKSIKC